MTSSGCSPTGCGRAGSTARGTSGGFPTWSGPVPVVVLVDEVAELFLMADKSEKEEVSRTLLRMAQLGRAFGVYLIICGQRIGADLGPGVTALRAQLSAGSATGSTTRDRECPAAPRCLPGRAPAMPEVPGDGPRSGGGSVAEK